MTMAKPKKPEQIVCERFHNAMQVLTHQGLTAPYFWYTHIANEQPMSGLSRGVAMNNMRQFRLMGFQSGTPDYLLFWLDGAGTLEAKARLQKKDPINTLKGGQLLYYYQAKDANFHHDLFASPDQAIEILVQWGALKPGARKHLGEF